MGLLDRIDRLMGGKLDEITGGFIARRRERRKNSASNVNFLKQLFGQMAFLPSKPINVDQRRKAQLGNRVALDLSTIKPISPYKVDKPYTGGRVRGLFVGINYTGTPAVLDGCVNDVALLLSTLEAIGFPLEEACILVDDPSFKGFGGLPTRENIINHMLWLVHEAKPGDVLFFHFSGHGSQAEDKSGDEEDGLDETLVPLDYQSAGCIVDDDIYEMMVSSLPFGVRMTAVIDCCHSGTLMDLPFEFAVTSDKDAQQAGSFRCNNQLRATHTSRCADVLMFSGCADDQIGSDVGNATVFGNFGAARKGNGGGAATNALSYVLRTTQGLSGVALLQAMRAILVKNGFTQTPQLSGSKSIDLTATFSFFGPISASEEERKAFYATCASAYRQRTGTVAPAPTPAPKYVTARALIAADGTTFAAAAAASGMPTRAGAEEMAVKTAGIHVFEQSTPTNSCFAKEHVPSSTLAVGWAGVAPPLPFSAPLPDTSYLPPPPPLYPAGLYSGIPQGPVVTTTAHEYRLPDFSSAQTAGAAYTLPAAAQFGGQYAFQPPPAVFGGPPAMPNQPFNNLPYQYQFPPTARYY